MTNTPTPRMTVDRYHKASCEMYETLRGIYPNDRRETGKPCSCGYIAAIEQYAQQYAAFVIGSNSTVNFIDDQPASYADEMREHKNYLRDSQHQLNKNLKGRLGK